MEQQVTKESVKPEHIFMPNELVMVHKGALTYSVTGNLRHEENYVGVKNEKLKNSIN